MEYITIDIGYTSINIRTGHKNTNKCQRTKAKGMFSEHKVETFWWKRVGGISFKFK